VGEIQKKEETKSISVEGVRDRWFGQEGRGGDPVGGSYAFRVLMNLANRKEVCGIVGARRLIDGGKGGWRRGRQAPGENKGGATTTGGHGGVNSRPTEKKAKEARATARPCTTLQQLFYGACIIFES